MLRRVSTVLRRDLRKLVRNSTLRDMKVEFGLVSQQQSSRRPPRFVPPRRLSGCIAVAMAAKPQAVEFQYRNALLSSQHSFDVLEPFQSAEAVEGFDPPAQCGWESRRA
jgi:hypothetical protein